MAAPVDSEHTLIAIMGPTASGKTDLAIELAREYKTEIISVDSRQFYREMNIGTAKPSPDQLAAVKHHFIDNLSIHDIYTAGDFARDAQRVIAELFKTHDTVVAVGGSTLYYKALLEGIDDFPEITAEAHQTVFDIEASDGITGLQKALHTADPEYYAKVDKNNPRRLARALEVSYSGGFPYSYWLNRKRYKPDYKIVNKTITLDTPVLYQRINSRCEQMINNGLLAEVEQLYPYRHLKPLHTVGYTEFFDYLDGSYGLEQAISLFKQHTRNYAKRQMTWLRNSVDSQ